MVLRMKLVKCTARTCRTLKLTGRNCGGFMNSVYDPALERCNARDIGACHRCGSGGGYFYRNVLVVVQESIYQIFTRVNRYKIAARFTRGRPLRTIRRLSNYTRYFTTVFITSTLTFICTQGKEVTFTLQLVTNMRPRFFI